VVLIKGNLRFLQVAFCFVPDTVFFPFLYWMKKANIKEKLHWTYLRRLEGRL